MLMSRCSVLVSLGAVVLGRCRVLLSLVVSAVFVMMRRFPMVVRGSFVVTGGDIMMLGRWVIYGRRHRFLLSARAPTRR
jgi:hypothetical protein